MSDRITFAAKVQAEGRRLRGSVVLAGSRTFRDGEWVEVDPKALMKADAADVRATIDHDPTRTVGRTKNGTLTVSRTETGIDFATADVPNVSYANDALELAHGDYYGGASFTIEGIRSKFSVDPETNLRVRTINSIKRLVDVAIVMDPAFANSSAAAFSKENNVKEQDPPEPQEPEPMPEPPKAKFSEPKAGMDWAEFAKTVTTDQLKNGMDTLMESAKGNLVGEQIGQYRAFAAEFQSRARADAQMKFEADNMALQHNIIMGRTPKAPQAEMFASQDYAEAFSQYLRSGNARLMEQFAQTITGSGAEGGFLVPDGFVAKIVQRLKAFGGIADAATEITTSTGESLRWPYIDDTANKAQLVAEDTQASTGADMVFDSIELGAFEYDASGASGNPIEVSLPLLQDAAFDVEALLTDLLGKRIGRKQADHLATGAGGTEPVGLLTKAADTMTATVASLAAPEHIFQVDAAYRNSGNCRWVMSDTTLAKLWSAQSTTNEPLFMPGRTINGKPFDMLYGYPVSIDPAAGDLVAFGDIKAGYIIRRVRGVQLLVDPYVPMVRRAVRYHAWARMDANIQDPNAYSVSTWASVTADT